jgi:hypothetical protein
VLHTCAYSHGSGKPTGRESCEWSRLRWVGGLRSTESPALTLLLRRDDVCAHHAFQGRIDEIIQAWTRRPGTAAASPRASGWGCDCCSCLIAYIYRSPSSFCLSPTFIVPRTLFDIFISSYCTTNDRRRLDSFVFVPVPTASRPTTPHPTFTTQHPAHNAQSIMSTTFSGDHLELPGGRKVYYVHSAPASPATATPILAIHGLGG